jgi:hypothetical protein
MAETSIKVVLSSSEQELVKHIAPQRTMSNRSERIINKRVGDQSDEFTDLNGFGGGLAFCKAMNLYPDFDIIAAGGDDLWDAKLPDGRRVDVKTSHYATANLVARKVQDDVDVFVLVRGQLPAYEIVGYATRQELVEAPKQDLGHGPTHFLAAKDLRPVHELFDSFQ